MVGRQRIYLCNVAFVKSASAYISRKRKRSFVLKQQQPCMSKYLSSRFNAICTPVYVSMSLDPILYTHTHRTNIALAGLTHFEASNNNLHYCTLHWPVLQEDQSNEVIQALLLLEVVHYCTLKPLPSNTMTYMYCTLA